MSQLSPIQLLACQPLKLCVELPIAAQDRVSTHDPRELGLEFYKQIQLLEPQDTQGEDAFAMAHTYQVSLGVRSPMGRPYAGLNFEMVYSGQFACTERFANNPHHTLRPEQMAYQHGLSVLYGAIRESFATMAARMGYPQVCLPLLNFMGETPTERAAPNAQDPSSVQAQQGTSSSG